MELQAPEKQRLQRHSDQALNLNSTIMPPISLPMKASGRSTKSVLGRASTKLRGRDFERIGYVAEGQELPDWMSVAEFMGYLKPFYPQWDDDLAKKLLHEFALPEQRALRHLSCLFGKPACVRGQ
jgi:ABC-2 type transport system ATP-binding protein